MVSISDLAKSFLHDNAGEVVAMIDQRPDWPLVGWALALAACLRVADPEKIRRIRAQAEAALGEGFENQLLETLAGGPATGATPPPQASVVQRCQWEFLRGLRAWADRNFSIATEHWCLCVNMGVSCPEAPYAKQFLLAVLDKSGKTEFPLTPTSNQSKTNDANHYFEEAFECMRRRDWLVASQILEKAHKLDLRLGAPIGDDSEFAHRLWVWADALFLCELPEKACQKFAHASKVDSRLGARVNNDADLAHRLFAWADALLHCNLLEESLKKFEQAYGLDPLNAILLCKWANALRRIKLFDKACQVYKQAYKIDQRLGACRGEDRELATVLTQWADALRQSSVGYSDEEACEKYEASQHLHPRMGAHNNTIIYAKPLCGWGHTLILLGLFNDACQKFKKAYDQDPRLGADPGDDATWATRLLLWAQALSGDGQFEEAHQKYREAAMLFEGLADPNVPNHAECRISWSRCLFKLHRLNEAMVQVVRAGELARATSGPKALIHGRILRHMARLGHAFAQAAKPCERRRGAHALLVEAVRLEEPLLPELFQTHKEGLRRELLGDTGFDLPLTSALAIQRWENEPLVGPFAMDTVLRRKGLVDDWEGAWRRHLSLARSPHVQERVEQWRELRTRWLVQQRMEALAPILDEEKRRQNESAAEALEEELSRAEQWVVSGFPILRTELAVRQAGLTEVADALPAGSVLVEYVQFSRSEFRIQPGVSPETRRAWYAAMVLRAQQPDSVELIDLGLTEDIDRRVGELTRTLHRLWKAPSIEEERKLKKLRWDLRQLVWTPVMGAVGAAQEVYIAPDGELHHLAFGMLAGGQAEYLLEEHSISYLHSGRDLLRARTEPSAAGPAVVIGGPDFDRGWRELPEEQRPPRTFLPLKMTKSEAVEVGKQLGCGFWFGEEATKERLLGVRSPRILHIASHGFLWAYKEPPSGWRPDDQRKPTAGDLSHCRSPLLRSGVALTGANLPLDQGGTEGLLFAAEVQEMGLEGTELAVMSLCQGGAGESFPGEGLYGLNRALSLAGVASRLTALWTVPDAATCILMQRFYQNLIVQRMGRLEALEEAQRLVRTLSREEWEELYRTSRWPELVKDTRRNESKERPFALPIFWAGFVLHGERGPLRGEIGRGGA